MEQRKEKNTACGAGDGIRHEQGQSAGAEAEDVRNAKAYDRIALQVKKGQREVIRAHAESKGLSLNAYINKLIAEDMEKAGE